MQHGNYLARTGTSGYLLIMSITYLDKLSNSVAMLEAAVDRAASLAEEHSIDSSGQLKERLKMYVEVVRKQRQYLNSLRAHILLEDWNEVSRCVRLIEASAQLIREDASGNDLHKKTHKTLH